ncbi:MAG: DUF1801 domain-containing protein [Bellilinea sp.]
MPVLDQQTLADYLSGFSREVQELVLKARALVFSVIPESIEQLDPSIPMIAYGTDRTYKGLICSITIFKTYINIMLAQGANLPDPDGLLRGTGKKARHIRIEKPDDLDLAGVRTILVKARQFHPGETH